MVLHSDETIGFIMKARETLQKAIIENFRLRQIE
jgi:hypothetical protein